MVKYSHKGIKHTERLQYSTGCPTFQACPKEVNDMKQMTQEERRMLEAFELHASRMNNIQAVLDLLIDSCPYEQEELAGKAAQELRLRAVRVMESISHLAQFYHDEAMCIVNSYYHSNS